MADKFKDKVLRTKEENERLKRKRKKRNSLSGIMANISKNLGLGKDKKKK